MSASAGAVPQHECLLLQIEGMLETVPLKTESCKKVVGLVAHLSRCPSIHKEDPIRVAATLDAFTAAIRASGKSLHRICSDLRTHSLVPALAPLMPAVLQLRAHSILLEIPLYVPLIDAVADLLLVLVEDLCLHSGAQETPNLPPYKDAKPIFTLMDDLEVFFSAASHHYLQHVGGPQPPPQQHRQEQAATQDSAPPGGYRGWPGAAAVLLRGTLLSLGLDEVFINLGDSETFVACVMRLARGLAPRCHNWVLLRGLMTMVLSRANNEKHGDISTLLLAHPDAPQIVGELSKQMLKGAQQAMQRTPAAQDYAACMCRHLVCLAGILCKTAKAKGMQQLQQLLAGGFAEGLAEAMDGLLRDPGAESLLQRGHQYSAQAVLGYLLMTTAGCEALAKGGRFGTWLATMEQLTDAGARAMGPALKQVYCGSWGVAPPRKGNPGDVACQTGGRGQGPPPGCTGEDALGWDEDGFRCAHCSTGPCVFHNTRSGGGLATAPAWKKAANRLLDQADIKKACPLMLKLACSSHATSEHKSEVLGLVLALLQRMPLRLSTDAFASVIALAQPRIPPLEVLAMSEDYPMEAAEGCVVALQVAHLLMAKQAVPRHSSTSQLLEELLLQQWVDELDAAAHGRTTAFNSWLNCEFGRSMWVFALNSALERGHLPAAQLLGRPPLPVLLELRTSRAASPQAAMVTERWMKKLVAAEGGSDLAGLVRLADTDVYVDRLVDVISSVAAGLPVGRQERLALLTAVTHAAGMVITTVCAVPDNAQLLQKLLGSGRLWVAVRQMIRSPRMDTPIACCSEMMDRLAWHVAKAAKALPPGPDHAQLRRLLQQRLTFLGWIAAGGAQGSSGEAPRAGSSGDGVTVGEGAACTGGGGGATVDKGSAGPGGGGGEARVGGTRSSRGSSAASSSSSSSSSIAVAAVVEGGHQASDCVATSDTGAGHSQLDGGGVRTCVVCGKQPKVTFLCSGCSTVRYCSQECQRRHWKQGGHKRECKVLQQQADATCSRDQ